MFRLLFTEQASADLDYLEQGHGFSKRLKAVRKALAYLEINPRHPGLNTHKYASFKGIDGEDVKPMLKIKRLLLTVFFGIMGPIKKK